MLGSVTRAVEKEYVRLFEDAPVDALIYDYHQRGEENKRIGGMVFLSMPFL